MKRWNYLLEAKVPKGWKLHRGEKETHVLNSPHGSTSLADYNVLVSANLPGVDKLLMKPTYYLAFLKKGASIETLKKVAASLSLGATAAHALPSAWLPTGYTLEDVKAGRVAILYRK